MGHVVLTGADSPIGRRVRARLADSALTGADGPDVRSVDLAGLETNELKRSLAGASVLVHLGRTGGPELDGTGAASVDVEGTRRLLDAAGDVGIERLVVLSSATVYGAWPTNPVPLTEDDPIRPHPALGFATHKAEVERLALAWNDAHPSATTAVLRSAVAVAEDRSDWLTASLWAGGPVSAGDGDVPAQFVHLDDLAEAVVLAAEQGLDGAYNVAPDGWLTGEELRGLAGRGPHVPLPLRAVHRLAQFRWKYGLTSTPPGVVAYRTHPWVVANDRLRSAGWRPEHTNAEAYVVSHPAVGWARVSPQRRQEIALVGTAVVATGVVAALVLLLRRWWRRR